MIMLNQIMLQILRFSRNLAGEVLHTSPNCAPGGLFVPLPIQAGLY
jgi:hypothetical protein